ncbi:MAG: hypothetical protein KC503_13075 [Myxococcales bacterium]|nr:hypothetical protein [Myxococcales bacterium]
MRRWLIVVVGLLVVGCSEDAQRKPVDGGGKEAGRDVGVGDTGPTVDADAAADAARDAPAGDVAAADTSSMSSWRCPSPLPSGWIFCEDFESIGDPKQVFYEFNDNNGNFRVVDTEGASGTHSLQMSYKQGQIGGSWATVAFGRNPLVNNQPSYRKTEDFTEVYWRFRIKHQQGWPDVGPAKTTRLISFAKPDWGQAMIAHLWSKDLVLIGDPVRCATGTSVPCSGINDFGNFNWIGQLPGKTKIFSSALSGSWHCVEAHVKLNTPGQSDGVFEFWIDGQQENTRSGMNWRDSYTGYGLNAVYFENYWNGGATADLERWFDDLVIATQRIGCN